MRWFLWQAVLTGVAVGMDSPPVSTITSYAIGYPGYEQRVSEFRNVLEEEGFGPVLTLRHTVAVPVERCAELRVGTVPLPLHSFYPNLVASGPNRVTGEVVYVGGGQWEEIEGRSLEGRIVAMELRSGRAWERLAGFGVKAFVFLQPAPGEATWADYRDKVLETPLEIPRLLLPWEHREAFFSSLRVSSEGHIFRDLSWRTVSVPTVAALIPGRERVLLSRDTSKQSREAVLLVHTRLDGTSLVPGLTPAGDTGYNLEILTSAVRTWRTNPPPISVLVVAFGAEGYALQSSREFGYRLLSRAGRPDPADVLRLESLRRDLVEWRDSLTPVVLGDPLPWLQKLARSEAGTKHPILIRLSALITLERNRISAEMLRRLDDTEAERPDDFQALAAQRDFLNYLSSLKYRAFDLQGSPTFRWPWVRKMFRATNADEPDPPEWLEMAPGELSSLLAELRRRFTAQIAACDTRLSHHRNDQRLREALDQRRIVFTVGLDLSASGDVMALVGSGDAMDLEIHRPLIRQIGTALRPFSERFNAGHRLSKTEPVLINVLDESRGEHWRRVVFYPVIGGSESLELLGIPGITLASANDFRPLFDTPDDHSDRISTTDRRCRLTRAVACVQGLCEEIPRLMADTTTVRRTPLLPTRDLPDNRYWGCIVGMATHPGSESSEKSMRGQEGVLVVRRGGLRQGWRGADIVATDENGEFRLPLVPTQHCPMGEKNVVSLVGFRLDPETGQIVQAADQGQSRGIYPTEFLLAEPEKGTVLEMFECETLGLLNCLDPRSFLPLREPRLYAGRGADSLRLFGRVATLNEREAAVACFVPRGQAVRLVFPGPDFYARLMILNSSAEAPLGRGIRAGSFPVLAWAEWQTAHDLWWRTETMRTQLAEAGIRSGFVDFLQDRAREALQAAEKARLEHHHDNYYRHASRAWSIATRAYPAVLRLAAGNVNGMVFYLFLILPASVLLERLLFSFTRIFARAATMGGIGVLLYQTVAALHPGIRILRNPLVLFISYGLITLTGYVLILVWSRFESFMSQVKLKSSGVTRERLARGAAFGLALSVGIGNMRRAPARTMLTLLALTLFTVVVVSLITVKPSLAVNVVRLPVSPGFDGLLVRSPSYEGLSETALDSIRLLAGRDLEVHPIRMTERVLFWTSGWATQGGVAGLPESALRRILVAGRLPEKGEQACLLPRLKEPDTAAWVGTVRWVAGQAIPVVGLFDPEMLEQLVAPDGEPLTPIDQTELREIRRIYQARGQEEIEIQAPRIPAARSVILSDGLAERMGNICEGILITSATPATLWKLARELILRTDYYVYLAEGGEARVLSVFDRARVRGLADIAVPLLICGLIIMNTMLGAVAAQMRHIPTFSAIGLAPKHIANLFFAEALAYAAIAVLAGFGVGQFSARLLAGTGWVSGMVLDYSSAASIFGCALVIGVTLLATILPAWQALNVAMPRADRDEKPRFEGGRMRTQLPFALTGHQAPGGIGFLMAYLREHEEALGAESFYIRDLVFERVPAPTGYEYRLVFDVWLAPLDLGNSQRVWIRTRTDEHGVMEIEVEASRLTGDLSSWRAANRGFLAALRKQMLLWRMVGEEDRERYVRMAQEAPEATSKERNEIPKQTDG